MALPDRSAILLLDEKGELITRAVRPAGAYTSVSDFGSTTAVLPADALVMEVQGAGDRILLRLDLRDGTEMLMVLDAATGTELGRIKLDHEKLP